MDHVIAGLDGRIDAVVDGGACEMGVESTIISLLDNPVICAPETLQSKKPRLFLGQTSKP